MSTGNNSMKTDNWSSQGLKTLELSTKDYSDGIIKLLIVIAMSDTMHVVPFTVTVILW